MTMGAANDSSKASAVGVPMLSKCLLLGLGQGGCAAAEYVHRHYAQDGLRVLLVDTTAAAASPQRLIFGLAQTDGAGCQGDCELAVEAFHADQALFAEQLQGCRRLLVLTALGGGTGTGLLLPLVEYAASLGIAVLALASTPYSFEGEDRQHLAKEDQQRLQELCQAAVILPADALQGTMPAVPTVDMAYGRLARWLGDIAAAMLQPYVKPLPEKAPDLEDAEQETAHTGSAASRGRPLTKAQKQLFFSFGELSLGIFSSAEPTRYNGQNLDVPTFQRRGLSIDRGDAVD
jgi:cell division protein FtsZ